MPAGLAAVHLHGIILTGAAAYLHGIILTNAVVYLHGIILTGAAGFGIDNLLRLW